MSQPASLSDLLPITGHLTFLCHHNGWCLASMIKTPADTLAFEARLSPDFVTMHEAMDFYRTLYRRAQAGERLWPYIEQLASLYGPPRLPSG